MRIFRKASHAVRLPRLPRDDEVAADTAPLA